MSKWHIRKTSYGDWIAEEQSELDIVERIKIIALMAVVFVGLLLALLIATTISDAHWQRREAKEQAKIEAQMAIEAPVWELDIVESTALYGSGKRKDYYGNEYTGEYREFCSWSNNESYTIVDVNNRNNYTRFSGTIFTRPEQDEELSITFKIYADGICIYDSGTMHATTPPKHINVDISGVDKLEFSAISSQSNGYCNPAVILENATVHAD